MAAVVVKRMTQSMGVRAQETMIASRVSGSCVVALSFENKQTKFDVLKVADLLSTARARQPAVAATAELKLHA